MERFSVSSGWKVLLADLGVPVREFLAMAQLPKDLFERRDASLASADYFRLWETLTILLGDAQLPLRILRNFSAEMFDPATFAAFCSPNLIVASQRIQQFKPLIGPMHLDIEVHPERLRLGIHFGATSEQPATALIAVELGYFVQIARMATRQVVVPLRVISPRTLEPKLAYEEFFGCTLELGDSIGLEFSRADAERPFITENQTMWALFEPKLQERLAELTRDSSIASQVRSVLLELVPSGITGADEVARKLAVSRRTLQRRLAEEKTSFSQVLHGLREELARHYIRNSELPYTQISFLLGYDDPNSFFRAFHGWTGTTPERLRHENKH